MSFVPDNSVTMGWSMPDEHTPELLECLRLARSTQLLVPCIWPYEFANSLGFARKKGRATPALFKAALDMISELDIRVFNASSPSIIPFTTDLMQAYSLTSYDASYLTLALETGLPLATLDEDLRVASVAAGVKLIF